MATSRTLLISGSLSDPAVRAHLNAAKDGSLDVVEFDTLHDRSLYPGVRHWSDLGAMTSLEQSFALNREAEDVIDLFLRFDVPDAGVPTHRGFRAACLSARAWRLTVPYLLNLYAARQAFETGPFDKIVVAAGSGVNLAAWREFAGLHKLPLEILPIQAAPMSLRRRLWKAWRRWRKPAAARLTVPAPEKRDGITTDSILCTSERIARLLAGEPGSLELPIFTLTNAETTASDTGKKTGYAELYRQWWKRWQQDIIHCGDELVSRPGTLASVRAIGDHAVESTYAEHACIYERALERLKSLRPKVLLCDTQIGTAERMWSLAAQELGIPVVAYVYDQVPNPRFSFAPDHVLSNSKSTTLISLKRGMPAEAITEVRSHRQTTLTNAREKADRRSPLILFADTYYPGTTSTPPYPNASYFCYRQIVETARRMPHLDFAIKFHPLREKKQEILSFVALDEHEISNRKEFVKGLNPPANLRFIEPEIRLTEELKKVSVMLNLNSTAAHEAFQMGVPVVFLQDPLPESMAYMRIHEWEACISAEDPEALVQKLNLLLSDANLRNTHIANQRRYLRDIYWPSQRPITEGLQMWLNQRA